MQYSKIISLTGLSGLYELVASKSDGAIVRSLEDNTTKFVSSRVHNFSHLESIEIYTQRENVNLSDIFKAMKESNEGLPVESDVKAVRAYFEKVYPELDFDRVYNSDMKKMVKWFKIIDKRNIDFTKPQANEEATAEEPVEEKVAEPAAEKEAKPKKKAAPRKKKTEE